MIGLNHKLLYMMKYSYCVWASVQEQFIVFVNVLAKSSYFLVKV